MGAGFPEVLIEGGTDLRVICVLLGRESAETKLVYTDVLNKGGRRVAG